MHKGTGGSCHCSRAWIERGGLNALRHVICSAASDGGLPGLVLSSPQQLVKQEITITRGDGIQCSLITCGNYGGCPLPRVDGHVIGVS